MSVSVLELLDNPDKTILQQKDSLPLIDIDSISARNIEKLIRVKAKVLDFEEPRGVIKVIAYKCEDGHVTKIDNPIINPPERLTTCPKCGKPVKVALDLSVPTDVRRVKLGGKTKTFDAFIVGAYATKPIEKDKEYIFTGTVKGKFDETTFQVEVTHLELYHFEEVKGKVEFKEGVDVAVQGKIIEKKPETPKPKAQTVKASESIVVPSVVEEKPTPSLFGAITPSDRKTVTLMENPKVVLELIGGERFVDVIKKYWDLTWKELTTLKDTQISEVKLRGEVAGTVVYLDAYVKGKTKSREVTTERNRISFMFGKHIHQIYISEGVKIKTKVIKVELESIAPKVVRTKPRRRDVGILAGLFGEEEEEEEERTARISNKIKKEGEKINIGDVAPVVSELGGLRKELGSEIGEVVINQIPKPTKRMITTQEISVVKEILTEIEDEMASIYGIPIDAIVERATEMGISAERVYEILNEMKKRGIIFDSIQEGYIKLRH